ncbi:MAG TPA: hypothetical protein VGZ02_04465 [Candidatus Baltobacteraceae bacterium]|jgi:hypothetical protein|nr:hypothetical protein [Candidatus Baltobacteraceae bacterium]
MKPRKDPDFEASADMRLVELQRAALGVPAPARGVWQSQTGAEGGIAPEEAVPNLAGPVVVCELTANPPSGVIPGAIVAIGLSIINEGAATARKVRVNVPLPGGAAYRNGSFVRDGRAMLDDAADELFSTGTTIGDMPPKTRVTFLWKIGVRMGNKPLVMAPMVSAEQSAVIGGEPLIVPRKEGAQSTFATQIERAAPVPPPPFAEPEALPFYELDAEETLEYEATAAALSPITEYRPPIEPPTAPEAPPVTQPEPVPPPAQPEVVPEPGVPEVEPETPLPPEQPPDVEPMGREAVALAGQIDRPSIAYFERIFTGSKPPTLLNHFILGGALACTRSVDGDDFAGLKAHLDAQGQLLQRIVLHERLGKKEPIAEYAGSIVANLALLTPRPVKPLQPPADANAAALYTELDGPTISVLHRMQEESARWDFTKARQLTLALQARSVIAAAPPEAVERADAALQGYARTASMQLQRFFVRMRIDRTTGLLFANDEQLDASARSLIAALTALFSA